MALIIETGLIVENADSYVSVDDAKTYANRRGILTFADLDTAEVLEPSLRVAFDYLNTRWEGLWKGSRIRPRDLGNGKATPSDATDIAFTAPSAITSTTTDLSTFADGEVIRITTESGVNDGDYHVSGTPTANALNVVETTLQTEAAGTQVLIEGVLLEQLGTWPRKNVVTPEGFAWSSAEIPKDIISAQIEYALAATADATSLELSPVPAIDASGRALTRLTNKAGALEQTKTWGAGTIEPMTIRPYPKADSLVKRWITGLSGRTIR